MGIKNKVLRKLEDLIKPQIERLLAASYDAYMSTVVDEGVVLGFDEWCCLVKDKIGE